MCSERAEAAVEQGLAESGESAEGVAKVVGGAGAATQPARTMVGTFPPAKQNLVILLLKEKSVGRVELAAYMVSVRTISIPCVTWDLQSEEAAGPRPDSGDLAVAD